MRIELTTQSLLALLTLFGFVATSRGFDGRTGSIQRIVQIKKPAIKWNNPPSVPIPGIEHWELPSTSMHTDIGYNVALPAGYASGDRRYPVIYFLHGSGGNENSDAAGFSALLRKTTDNRRFPPAICVFPNGGMSGYVDRPDQKVMMETFLLKELIPFIDRQYRTVATQTGRAIAGFSMGGGGAVRLALKYPNTFSSAASWAGAFGSSDSIRGPAALAREHVERIKGKVKLLLIVGDQDMTYSGHAPLVQALKSAKISVDYVILPGVKHDLGAYYSKSGTRFAQFLLSGFANLSDDQ